MISMDMKYTALYWALRFLENAHIKICLEAFDYEEFKVNKLSDFPLKLETKPK